MKIVNSIACFFASAIFWGACSTDDDDIVINSNNVKEFISIGASTPDSQTRAYINNGFNANEPSQTVYWHDTDDIAIFTRLQEEGDDFKWSKWSGTFKTQASFAGSTYNHQTEYVALYPYQNNAKYLQQNDGKYKLQFTIPAEQKAVKDNFDPLAGIQVAKSTAQSAENPIDLKSADLQFNHVCGYFVLSVKDHCTTIELEAKDGWALAGEVKATINNNGASDFEFVERKSKISITDIPEDGGTFFIAFIPSSGTVSMEVTIGYDQSVSHGGVIAFPISSNKALSAGRIYKLADY